MSKNKLFVDAVAEAKQLKEAALAQAKIAMAESFAPRVQSMLQTKLNEMEEEEMNEEKSLEEILNEMETEDTTETEVETPELEMGEETDEFGEEEGGDEVAELTVDELKDVIRDVMMELEGGETEEEMESEMDMEPEMETEEEEDIDLDEILAEMNGGSVDPANAAAAGLDNIIDMVKSAIAKSPEMASKIAEFIKSLPAGAGAALRSEVKELEEAKKEIVKVKKQLSEMNLLNAKLIYVNKVFKSTNLSESKKVAVINAFDRAANVKEVQNTFQTIKESIGTSQKSSPLVENRGFASKAAGVAKKEVITESVDFVARMQKLAGIK
jgi:hypothetical protein